MLHLHCEEGSGHNRTSQLLLWRAWSAQHRAYLVRPKVTAGTGKLAFEHDELLILLVDLFVHRNRRQLLLLPCESL
jgi:hypothetical protein